VHHGEERTRRLFVAGITSFPSNFLSERTIRELSCFLLSSITDVDTYLSFDIRFAERSLNTDSDFSCNLYP